MRPLSQKTRFISLSILFFIFLLIAPVILANSFGYKIRNLGDVFTLIKTGGIYIHSNLNNTSVFLNGDFYKSNGIFLRNTLIDNLIPERTYEILVQKEGYHDYLKEVYVFPSIVSEVRILMLPKEIEKREILPYFDGLGLATTSSTVATNPKLKFQTNTEYQEFKILFDGEATTTDSIANLDVKVSATSTTTQSERKIPKYFEKLGITDPDLLNNLITLNDQVAWIEKGDIILNWIDENNTTPYYYCLILEKCRDRITLNWDDEILAFDFMPGRSDIFIVLVKDGIYAVEVDDRSERNIQPIYLGQNLEFKISNNNRIIVREDNIFYELSL